MKRGGYRSPTVEKPHEWIGDDAVGIWHYGDYRCCYLTVRRLDNNMYKPSLGSENNIPYPNHDLPDVGYFEYPTLHEAKKHCFEYVDYIRDYHDSKAKEELYNVMHQLRPTIFLT